MGASGPGRRHVRPTSQVVPGVRGVARGHNPMGWNGAGAKIHLGGRFPAPVHRAPRTSARAYSAATRVKRAPASPLTYWRTMARVAPT
jgi:hypothetical protein